MLHCCFLHLLQFGPHIQRLVFYDTCHVSDRQHQTIESVKLLIFYFDFQYLPILLISLGKLIDSFLDNEKKFSTPPAILYNICKTQ